jgi:hypothetical protein
VWRNRFGRGFGPVVSQTEGMDEWYDIRQYYTTFIVTQLNFLYYWHLLERHMFRRFQTTIFRTNIVLEWYVNGIPCTCYLGIF